MTTTTQPRQMYKLSNGTRFYIVGINQLNPDYYIDIELVETGEILPIMNYGYTAI